VDVQFAAFYRGAGVPQSSMFDANLKEKSMRSLSKLIVVACAVLSVAAHAAITESACVTVTAVINEESGNAIQLVLSPATAVPGCTPNTSPGVEFAIGVNGITASSLNSYLASGLASLVSGRQIMVVYDNSTSSCYGISIANGGFHGEC
jgi:hypothetical protein